MTKKDFVMAWLLASQAGGKATSIHTNALIEQALEIYELLEDLNDTDNGVSDL
jgi:hypothetical protein